MLMEDARERIVAYGKRIATEGLAVGTSGNLSEYDPETGLMAISPSGLGYFETTPADVVVLQLDDSVVEGSRRPSSEAPLHAEVYRRRPAARAVVHTHSPYATTLAALGEPIRAVHFTIADSGAEEVPLSPYVTFGTPELAASVMATSLALLPSLGHCVGVTCGDKAPALAHKPKIPGVLALVLPLGGISPLIVAGHAASGTCIRLVVLSCCCVVLRGCAPLAACK